MPNVEERLASLEARMDSMSDLRTLIIEMRGDVNRQLVDARDDMNRRFAEVNGRFGEMNRQITDFRDDVNRRVHALDEKEDRHFTWVIGIQVASILAVVGVLAGAYYR